MQFNELLTKLTKVKKLHDNEWMACCPGHADKTPSLHITLAGNKILLKCQAGCDTSAVCDSLGIKMDDLFLTPKAEEKKIVATYDYKDESGNVIYQVVRYQPKSFAQRHKNGNGEWAWNMEGVKRVLYHLPEILQENGTIYLVEGEKDCDNLWEYGMVATTSPGGASAWNPEYADYLNDKRVVVIPDNDEAGLSYARAVVKSLQGKARETRCVILPKVKDFSDWIPDNDIAELPALEQDISVLFTPESVEYKREADSITWAKGDYLFRASSIRNEKTGVHAKLAVLSDYQVIAWGLINIERSEDRTRLANQVKKNDEDIRKWLDLFCAGLWDYQVSSTVPEVMFGDDNITAPKFYLYPYIMQGGGTILFAAPGRGKSYSALLWAQSINTGTSKFWKVEKSPVLFINLERSRQSLQRRLSNVNRILGLPTDTPLLTFNTRGKSLQDIAPGITKAVNQYGIKLVILDSISRAGYGDLTENRPINAIIDTLSSFSDSWLALGHTTRSSEDHVYGSIMLDAGADLTIQLKSQTIGHVLGLAFDITKKNDLPDMDIEIWALEFEEWKLKSLRKANPFEFPDIESKKRPNMMEDIINFILEREGSDATASEIEAALGYNRTNVSNMLNKSGKFTKTRKVKTSQYYGVLEDVLPRKF